ncbi:guanine nucleotide-binding protein-like 1 [Mercenaria mercenaria]|uniref:guanine nucleotide-binding protein-like 1 n=1 Tax=Mercenaria mercenaria TaxID=6596 RepID=UPI00234ED6CB|nr:guanine nucleotide-binding protein-like 1 [Mercenaria mercenaria]
MPRKKPFSSKQKKKQLQEKRQRKQASGPSYLHDSDSDEAEEGLKVVSAAGKDSKHDSEAGKTEDGAVREKLNLDKHVEKINSQPNVLPQHGRYDPNRYRLHFFKESRDDMAKRKERTRQPYTPLPEECLEMDMDIGGGNFIDIPKRPPWDYKHSKKQLENNEERYFKSYLDTLFSEHNPEKLSYMELNLETWRQLWRVLEMSDVFLIITDIRHPAMHFPPALYTYITEELKKSVIIVLNKVDLAPPPLVVAWQHYFKEQFPLVDVVCFSSFPKSKEEVEQMSDKIGKVVFKKRKRGTYRALGPKELHNVCKNIVQSEVDLSSWEHKIEVDQGVEADDSSSDDYSDDNDEDDEDIDEHLKHKNKDTSHADHSFEEHDRYRDGILTIGCVGYPNVGKSSVINGLMGKKVVSVSRTPGHTKHFQTIYLTPTVKLCDCPGLVFPSKIDRNLQILGGMYPISQVQEPYSTINYLAERLDLPKLLRIKHLDEDVDEKSCKWSAIDICEAWADKRGFLTAKAARLDTYRSANNLLRMALEGRLCLCLYPKGFVKNKDFWENHSDTAAFIDLQNMYRQKVQASANSNQESTDSSTSETELDQKNVEESSQGRQSETFTSSNPFALLGEEG